MNSEAIVNQATEIVLTYGPKLAAAIAVLIVGGWLVKVIVRGVDKGMEKGRVDPALRPFLVGIAGMLLKAMLIISVLGMLGIEMTSFIAVLGAAGLAVGMALSGTLQNFAGGVMILLFKPYQV